MSVNNLSENKLVPKTPIAIFRNEKFKTQNCYYIQNF